MSAIRAYEEVVGFIATESPRRVVDLQPAEATKARVPTLVTREKGGLLTPVELSELGHYLQLEHIMRLAKARAKHYLAAS